MRIRIAEQFPRLSVRLELYKVRTWCIGDVILIRIHSVILCFPGFGAQGDNGGPLQQPPDQTSRELPNPDSHHQAGLVQEPS